MDAMARSRSETGGRYLRRVLLLERGGQGFHERVHYWQHVGTTFGAFQLLGSLITFTAMRIALGVLTDRGLLQLPVSEATLDRVDDPEEQSLVARALEWSAMMLRYEVDDLESPREFATSTSRWYCKSATRAPVLRAGEGVGYAVGAVAVSEFHVSVLEKIRGRNVTHGQVERAMGAVAERLLGAGHERVLAFLCDWALMMPNPNLIVARPGEAYPGWRFVKGLEKLSESRPGSRTGDVSYSEFTRWLANSLEWQPPETVIEHYASFVGLAERHSRHDGDAWRNRAASETFAGLLTQARAVRLACPEAFALPHVHERLLLEQLPVVPEKLFEDTSRDRSAEWPWHNAYMGSASLVLQVFGGEESIVCAYRHLGIADKCGVVSEHDGDTSKCLTLRSGRRPADTHGCGFEDLCERLRLMQIFDSAEPPS